MRCRDRLSARVAHRAARAACGLVGLGVFIAPITAQDGRDVGATPEEPRSCIPLNVIDRTSVIDDNTILFYGRGGDVYRNDLPRSCPELRNEQRFMYRTSLAQLCSNDTITVLQDVGFGFMPGPTCGLGKFAPITKDEANDLEQRSQQRSQNRDGEHRRH
jgi:hypothetical protein